MAENKKFKFNFIDVIIILVVVSMVFALIYLYRGKTNKTALNTGTGVLTYSVEVEEAPLSYPDAMRVGDMVIFGNSSSDSAIITNIEVRPSEHHVKDTVNGGYKTNSVEGACDVIVTMEGNAVKGVNDIKIGSSEIRTGELFEGKAKSKETGKAYFVEGYVLGMDME